MVKKMAKIVAFTFLLFALVTTNQLTVSANYNIPNEVRVALKTLYFNKQSITVYNDSLTLGYLVNGDFKTDTVIKGYSQYYFMPVDGFFVVSKQIYKSYDEVKNVCSTLQLAGYPAFAGNTGLNQWKIYLGRYASKNVASQSLNQIKNRFKEYQFEISSDNNTRYKIQTDNGPYVIVDSNQGAQIAASDNAGILDLNERQYRGRLEFLRNSNKMSAVNVVPLEEYLCSVVGSEVTYAWEMEALKAQALAARTYALYYTLENPRYKDEPYDLCDTIVSQSYNGYAAENEKINEAVFSTMDEVITYNNRLIFSCFSSTSGGRTENSENVWSAPLPYLKGVSDICETVPAKDPWIVVLSKNEIAKKLNACNLGVGNVVDVKVSAYTPNDRVLTLTVIGTNGVQDINKETIRNVFNLKSRKFTLLKSSQNQWQIDAIGVSKTNKAFLNGNLNVVGKDGKTSKISINDNQIIASSTENIKNYPILTLNPNSFAFAGMGYGHGAGFSQSGAQGMALEGYDCYEIVKHYFTGTEVENLGFSK